ncbi:uncharacterized protein Bfra_006989, partial [Botrytis fragariae]
IQKIQKLRELFSISHTSSIDHDTVVDDDKTSTECNGLINNQWVIKFKLHNRVGMYPYILISEHKVKSVITGSHSDQVSVRMDRVESNELHEIRTERLNRFVQWYLFPPVHVRTLPNTKKNLNGAS